MKLGNLKSNIIILSLAVLTLSSCKKWLEVQPEDKFIKEQTYGSKTAIAEIVNGFYLTMGTDSLYGENLTLKTLDLFAQRYYQYSSSQTYYNYGNLDYTESNVKSNLQGIWTNMYSLIGNINDFVSYLPQVNNTIISEADKNQYLGEAIGLRAFLHFDLLRMWGPVYNEANKSQSAIPYYTSLGANIEDFSTAEQAATLILKDIAEAETLLQNDPILTTSNETSTTNSNNNRFNYYALIGLKARVYQWIGDKENALKAAQIVIAAQNKFPWTAYTDLYSSTSPDRVFFKENMFAIFNSSLYVNQTDLFDASLFDSQILYTNPENDIFLTDSIFESNVSDYRMKQWTNSAVGSKKTFLKYENISSTTALQKYMIPLLRISEMYYIAAESTDDRTTALAYLNTVRAQRGLSNTLADSGTIMVDIPREIRKEYLKEFYGEGQLWYYYKRNQITNILCPSGDATYHKTISASKFVFDIPDNESAGR